MAFRLSERALRLARENGGHLRLAVRPGPIYARPMLLDFFHEDGAPADHAAFAAGGVTVWVPSHLTWIAENDVAIEAAADGHVHGAIDDVRLPY